MKNNQHVQAIPSTVLTQVQTKIDEVTALLAPYLLALTPVERKELPKMGEKTIAFVEKAYDFALQNPNLVPPYLEVDAFGLDFADAHGLWTLLNTIQQLEESVDDTEMAAGSEAYQAALVFYQSVKTSAAQDIPGAKAVYEELRTRFPQRGGGANRTSPKPLKRNTRLFGRTIGTKRAGCSVRNKTGSVKGAVCSILNRISSVKRASGSIPNRTGSAKRADSSVFDRTAGVPGRTGYIERRMIGLKNPDCSVRDRMGLSQSPGGLVPNKACLVGRRTVGVKSLDGSALNRMGLIMR
jgi:hypothetical protein